MHLCEHVYRRAHMTTETLSIRIDAETKKRLSALSKRSKRSKSFLAAEAIAAYVESVHHSLPRSGWPAGTACSISWPSEMACEAIDTASFLLPSSSNQARQRGSLCALELKSTSSRPPNTT